MPRGKTTHRSRSPAARQEIGGGHGTPPGVAAADPHAVRQGKMAGLLPPRGTLWGMTTLRFLGGAGTVTGSKYLLEHGGRRILLDCGLFQGEKAWRLRNWAPFPVPPGSVDAVVLSHAHIDHTGHLPRLVQEGFAGPVHATPATQSLLRILLPDSGRLQEEEAALANQRRTSRHDPALPLYTEAAALRALRLVRPLRYETQEEIADGVVLTFHRAGHLLGSALVRLDLYGPAGYRHTLVFSGDLGRFDMPVVQDPAPLGRASTLLLESTYGDRDHVSSDPDGVLEGLVQRVLAEDRVLLVPAFAVGRTQDLLYRLRRLQLAGRIPARLPLYVDSPMARDATPLFLEHREEHDEEMLRLLDEGQAPLAPSWLEFVRGLGDSYGLLERSGPQIVISASGMATGGRILHHLARRLPDPKTTVLFTGYQAQGTRGRALVDGAKTVKLHGEAVPVRAEVLQLGGLSAHADRAEVDRWLSSFGAPPSMTYCVHGEPRALEGLRARLEARGWPAKVPAYLDEVELPGILARST